MEAAPPSYEKATLNNAWDLIAKYISSSDLCSTALVCQEWHSIFVPHLWGNPAAHFGTENDRVYVALTRFKQTLPWARLYVRSFTHTLHLPPAHAEIYNGPHADWLREVLDRLPNLQSLIVRGLPFFDHSALVALKHRLEERNHRVNAQLRTQVPVNAVELPAQLPSRSQPFQLPRVSPNGMPTFGLRLLDASRCTNTTATGLHEALKRLDQLLYLDLSHTYAARDQLVLGTMRNLCGLQVLKLRGIHLRDTDIETLAPAIGTRVRSLDVRSNQLTDRSVRTLLQHCFISPSQNNLTVDGSPGTARSPALLQYLGHDMLSIYQGDEFEGYLRNAFTTSFISRLAIEAAPEGGITHFYIADNNLTVEGISGLIRSERLHVLDARVESHMIPALDSPRGSHNLPHGPGAEKLATLFVGASGDNIRHLKISHEIVTKKSSKADESILQGRVEIGESKPPPVPLPEGIIELDATPINEMPASTAAPVYELSSEAETRSELPGDALQMVVSPAIGKKPQPTEQEEQAYEQARREGASAPEVVTEETRPRPKLLHPDSAVSSDANSTPTVAERSDVKSRPRTYSNLAREREGRSRFFARTDGFHPALTPHIKTLTLTDFPAYSESTEVADRFVTFIEECAVEARSARQQARFDYTAPPGRNKANTDIREAAKDIFGLQTVIIEIAPESKQRGKGATTRWAHANKTSMTGDRDSQALWSAAEADFSFFGDDEEVMFPSLEPQARSAYMQSVAEKQLVSDMSSTSIRHNNSFGKKSQLPQVDNIARISQFRRAKKAHYEDRVRRGETDPDVEGYWPGVVQVVRNSGNKDPFGEEDESRDYFGNIFSKGYLYK